MPVERIDLPSRIRISATVNPLSRLSRWKDEWDLPPCPAGATIMIECVEVNGAATVDLIEEAFLKRLDTVVVTYSQESGNRYSCMLCEFSLGEAAILIQAIDALENKTSGSDRHVALINKWADDFKTRTEKKYANGTP